MTASSRQPVSEKQNKAPVQHTVSAAMQRAVRDVGCKDRWGLSLNPIIADWHFRHLPVGHRRCVGTDVPVSVRRHSP